MSQSLYLKRLYGSSREMTLSQNYFQLQNSIFFNNNKNSSDNEIADFTPRMSNGVSMAAAITLDLAVPGGGHFYLGNIGYGIGFLLLKCTTIYFIYHFFREYDRSREAYYSARMLYQVYGPGQFPLLPDRNGNLKTLTQIEKMYDISAQMILFTVAINILVYTVSALLCYFDVKEINEQEIPTFQIGYFYRTEDAKEEMFTLRYTYSFY